MLKKKSRTVAGLADLLMDKVLVLLVGVQRGRTTEVAFMCPGHARLRGQMLRRQHAADVDGLRIKARRTKPPVEGSWSQSIQLTTTRPLCISPFCQM